MKRVFHALVLTAAVLASLPDRAAAQSAPTTRFRVALGASVGIAKPTREDLDSGVGFGAILRLRPRKGFGPSIGFSWFRTENENLEFRFKPVMVGGGYSIPVGRAWIAPSLVAGISFNRAEIKATGERPRMTNSFAMRPGVSLWFDVSERVGLNTFAGYVITRPELSFGNAAGSPPLKFKADAFVWSAGMAVYIF